MTRFGRAAGMDGVLAARQAVRAESGANVRRLSSGHSPHVRGLPVHPLLDSDPRFATPQRSPALCPKAIRGARRTLYRELDANLASGYATLSKIVDGGAAKGKTQ